MGLCFWIKRTLQALTMTSKTMHMNEDSTTLIQNMCSKDMFSKQ
ncbi:hypothetical protein [Methanobrevibacter millerae]|nr:hypothetical protein [Methanobrevibacter millerae]